MRPGDLIAERFVVERLASSGGMGSVFRALDRHTGEVVALKMLHQPAQGAVRFLREAQVLAELRHPAIVRYVAHGVTPAGEAFLAIEWLEGVDLAARILEGPLGLGATLTIGTRVAAALGAAHARGVVHRDVKPSNLFLPDRDPARVKVLDFGVARIGGAASATRTGAIVGTPAYMAPEQARGERQIDARADVFALGCVIFECLTCRPPFLADQVMAVLAKVLLEEAPRASELVDGVPPALDDLIARMLSKEREARPADGLAVAEALDVLEAAAGATTARAGAPPSAIGAREQRLVSVVLASPPAAPDDAAVLAALGPFGARVEWLMDGSLLALLVGRGSASDQAAQAARCALALRGALPDAPLALALGRATVLDRWPVGDVIDRAARLLGRAAPTRADLTHTPRSGRAAPPAGAARPSGTRPPLATDVQPIRLDEVTAGLLDARFDVRGDASGLWLGGEREQLATGRTLLGKTVPCVGRERELGVLAGLFDECVSEPVARAVLITAAAGVGKSRLRAEFLRKVEERGERVEVLLGLGDPMSAGSPFAVLAPAIRRAAGVRDGEPLAVRQQKVRARAGRNLSGEARARVAEFLGELVSAPFPDDDSVQLRAARQDPMLMGDQMRRAWEDFLAAECAERPVVIVLENLHWGDLPSIKFIDAALRNLADAPLLVLALARPEVREAFPRLWEERGVQEIRLAELTRRGSERLVREALGDGVDDATLARIVAQAAGNAYYLEELIRAVAAGKGSRLPETVLAMVEARLEELDPDARRVLRAASTFGQVFWLEGVCALLGERQREADVLDWLSTLERLEMVARQGEGKFPGQLEFAFRSLALREAAYATFTEADRVVGHRLAGGWLEAAGESDPLVLGEHFERGGDPRHAIAWYRAAGEQALEASDFVGAVARAQRGVLCGAEGQELGALRLLQSEAQNWRGDHAEALQCGLDAMQWLPRGSALWYTAAGEVATASGKLGQVDRLVALAESFLGAGDAPGGAQAVAFARLCFQLFYAGRYELGAALLGRIDDAEAQHASQDPIVLGRVYQARSVWALYADEPVPHLRWTVLAVESFERAGDVRNSCMQRCNLGNANMQLGAWEEAERALRDALQAAQRMGLGIIATIARHNLGYVLAGRGALEEALANERKAVEEALAQGDRRLRAATHIYLALLLVQAGELPEAERMARDAVESAGQLQPIVAYANGALARILLAEGRTRDAMGAAIEAIRILGELGKIEAGESLIRLAYAECLYAMGERDRARDAIRNARERLLRRAARIADPAYRQMFLERIRDNAQTLALARDWAGEEERPWASPTLPPE